MDGMDERVFDDRQRSWAAKPERDRTDQAGTKMH
jgi:hypothetical protein